MISVTDGAIDMRTIFSIPDARTQTQVQTMSRTLNLKAA